MSTNYLSKEICFAMRVRILLLLKYFDKFAVEFYVSINKSNF